MTKHEQDGLRECPFCGSDAERVIAEEWGYFAIECITCTAKMDEKNEEAAIAAWNRRVNAKQTDKIPQRHFNSD